MLKIVLHWRLKQIRSEKEKIRSRGARKLSKARDTRAVQPLINMLKDEEDYVRTAAAIVLGEICDMQTVPALMKAMEDGNEDIHRAVALAMGMIRDTHTVYKFVPLLKGKDIDDRTLVQDKLIELGNEWADQIKNS